ncbi:uncharacterized protein MELLADRAFT_90786 [Melampsora larici-populina 98AG31]|uniref:Alpha-type protein kinase domain-containing protein n=1 Tax=Melampsora larici-populina (strain 98AG31 / pathotype 3-4-7) TaxID=747676 RepID=F4R7H1_MELLP|nr:uncharacterized protein MELLADRAFT_90786 [Melampsora larici-populina 98AG31]EGG11316.1 hypothetical protein MELLADRAFT_90786 [Melampsora larici-populina 98AG31]
MVGNPYIGTKYRRLPSYPIIPQPAYGKPVGLACPECPPSSNASLVYSSKEDDTKDTLNVNCPSVKHFCRTFKLNQLRHEIALINAGGTYPIPFDASAHGPPVNAKGMTLAPRISPKKSTQSKASNRTTPAIDCARPQVGPTAKCHKKTGHAGCVSIFCKSCCQEFTAPDVCYVHRVKEPPATPSQVPNVSTTPALPRRAPPVNAPAPKRPKLIPAQCAQYVRRVGHILSDDEELLLESSATKQSTTPAVDPLKVVSIHLVTMASQTPVISHLFNDWPVAILKDNQSLLRAAQAAAGPQWNNTLVVWDEAIRNWIIHQREIGVTLPHTYTTTSRNLVVCLPHQRAALTLELQDILEGLSLGKPLVRKPPVQSSSPIIKLEPITPGPVPQQPQPSSSVLRGSRQNPISLEESDSEIELPRPETSTSQQAIPSTPESDTQVDVKPCIDADFLPRSGARAALRVWPGADVLLSSLLSWILKAGNPPRRKARMKLWKKLYGKDYLLANSTVYRYASWVDLVGYKRMYQWSQEWPEQGVINKYDLTVAQSRPFFQKEYDVVSFKRKNTAGVENEEASGEEQDEQSEEEEEEDDNAIRQTPDHFFPARFISWYKNGVYKRGKNTNMSLYSTVGFLSPKEVLSDSENFGWNALPFDDPQVVQTDVGDRDHVFGLVRREDVPTTASDALRFQWGCKAVNVTVDRAVLHQWDGRTTHSAVYANSIPMEVTALAPWANSIHDHLRFAQVLAHAACLLNKFDPVVRQHVLLSHEESETLDHLQIVPNLVLRKMIRTKQLGAKLISFFNLRQTLHGAVPKYITSDCEFAPRHHIDSFFGRLFECFTHWTYEYHGRQALLCGFRGVESTITDVTMMDNTRPWFLQNPYTGGLQLFASTHVCGHMCRDIGLTTPPPYYPVGAPPVDPQED